MSIPQTGGGPIEHHDELAQYLDDGCKPKVPLKRFYPACVTVTAGPLSPKAVS